ncbi:MAG: Mrp/NBP35 family ATP-binding protein [Chloroflexi bacterium]|jgi:ATP-binding protein involved in chromosome partitioning|nr:Mrp/NBP35 family ATP-binding protein [Chloroflexota bacterium]MBT3669836.1 Mrp/NBP35 family ATP-binding protein [Chloroflexota bacterium]MBT4002848.1 Mrp/NBP35 family ATP-binding protein [Chloroflexota bacterium]MBT4304737.1 Mrp/NBP35 family ATP-binding protein [Chloroflexota bacterium]MBT4534761.1 Mrp/NBP35 family ATP-binding protein [Chloroflexota bacterium]
MVTEIKNENVLAAISKVKDPALNKSLVSAFLVRDIAIEGEKVSLTLVLISPEHPFKEQMVEELKTAILGIEGVKEAKINSVVEVPTDAKVQNKNDTKIKNVIAVASGKGGVGKSTVSVNIAVALAKTGVKVGLMDADLYGPNIPIMMGVERLAANPSEEGRISPAEAHGVKMISIGFMVPPDQPIVWRGPMLHTAIRQFIEDVDWGEIDYLVVDLPPGTGDTQLSLAQTLSVTGSVIVTLPQQVSLDDARRGLEMFRQLQIPIFGVVENMSYLEMPDGERVDVFGAGGGEKLAEEADVPFMGAIPMDPAIRKGGDSGMPIVLSRPDSVVSKVITEIAYQTALRSSVLAIKNQSGSIPINIVG